VNEYIQSLLHSHLLWYLNRGTGVVLVAVLTLSTALGLLSASGRGSRRWPRFARQTLHRNVSVIACALLVAHAVTPVLDTYVNNYAPISWVDALVPFVSAYKPLALGLGTLALDLVVVVVLSSVARRRFGHRAWFSLHLLSYAAWALGLVHGFLIGSDARTTWGLGVTVGAVAVVLAALVARLVRPAPEAALEAAREDRPDRAAEHAGVGTRGRRRANRRDRQRAEDEAYGLPYGQGYGAPYAQGYGQGYGQGQGYAQEQTYLLDPGDGPTYVQDSAYVQDRSDERDQRYVQGHAYVQGQAYVQAEHEQGAGYDPRYDARYDGDDLRYDPLTAPEPEQTRRGRRAGGRRAQV
jgi:DMSO/TMAO reductase YedYZ heme-binding membrane subunit